MHSSLGFISRVRYGGRALGRGTFGEVFRAMVVAPQCDRGEHSLVRLLKVARDARCDSCGRNPSFRKQERCWYGCEERCSEFRLCPECYMGPSGKQMAVKQVISSDQKLIRQCEAEAKIMSQHLKHKNIVRVFGHDVRPRNRSYPKTFYMFMELVLGASLDHNIRAYGPIPEPVMRQYIRQCLEALKHCRERNVIHRDLKGRNILITHDGVVKLTDFGSALITDDPWELRPVNKSGSECEPDEEIPFHYTLQWVAPEVVQADPVCNHACDVWSLGCVVIEMRGAYPWSERLRNGSPIALLHDIANTNLTPKIPRDVSGACRGFIKKCLVREPLLRSSASDLLQDLWLSPEVAVDVAETEPCCPWLSRNESFFQRRSTTVQKRQSRFSMSETWGGLRRSTMDGEIHDKNGKTFFQGDSSRMKMFTGDYRDNPLMDKKDRFDLESMNSAKRRCGAELVGAIQALPTFDVLDNEKFWQNHPASQSSSRYTSHAPPPMHPMNAASIHTSPRAASTPPRGRKKMSAQSQKDVVHMGIHSWSAMNSMDGKDTISPIQPIGTPLRETHPRPESRRGTRTRTPIPCELKAFHRTAPVSPAPPEATQWKVRAVTRAKWNGELLRNDGTRSVSWKRPKTKGRYQFKIAGDESNDKSAPNAPLSTRTVPDYARSLPHLANLFQTTPRDSKNVAGVSPSPKACKERCTRRTIRRGEGKAQSNVSLTMTITDTEKITRRVPSFAPSSDANDEDAASQGTNARPSASELSSTSAALRSGLSPLPAEDRIEEENSLEVDEEECDSKAINVADNAYSAQAEARQSAP